MDGHLQQAYVAALIESIESRPEVFDDHLAAALLQRCWPSGTDCEVPRGAIRVHDALPETYSIVPPECTCDTGHCALCN